MKKKITSSTHEIRIAAPQRFEVRENSDGTQTTIAGNAVVYGAESQELGYGFIEKIAPGAFRNSLRTQDQLALFNHDDGRILGRKSSGTLTLTDSPASISFSCTLPNTPDGHTVAELCRRGDLQGMSFGMIVTDDDWSVDMNGRVLRTVKAAELHEISVVSTPAYTQTTVSLRSCPLALRSRITQRNNTPTTMTVDDVALPASSFAYVGDSDDPSTWLLPVHFPGDVEKTKAHIIDALTSFDQTDGIPDDQKSEVYARIVGAAKAHGIAVAKESLRDADDDVCDENSPDYDPILCDDDDDEDDDDDLRSAHIALLMRRLR